MTGVGSVFLRPLKGIGVVRELDCRPVVGLKSDRTDGVRTPMVDGRKMDS